MFMSKIFNDEAGFFCLDLERFSHEDRRGETDAKIVELIVGINLKKGRNVEGDISSD